MADAGVGLACGSCLVGNIQQWWFTKDYGANGIPGATKKHSRWLAFDCGFEDDGEADSIYEQLADANEDDFQAYLRGQPLPRKPPTTNLPPSSTPEPPAEPVVKPKPSLLAWPEEMRPALTMFSQLEEHVRPVVQTVDAKLVKPAAAVVLKEMDQAKLSRPADAPPPPLVRSPDGKPTAAMGMSPLEEEEKSTNPTLTPPPPALTLREYHPDEPKPVLDPPTDYVPGEKKPALAVPLISALKERVQPAVRKVDRRIRPVLLGRGESESLYSMEVFERQADMGTTDGH